LEAKRAVHDLSNLYPEILDDIYISFPCDYLLTATVTELIIGYKEGHAE